MLKKIAVALAVIGAFGSAPAVANAGPGDGCTMNCTFTAIFGEDGNFLGYEQVCAPICQDQVE